jgi:hypothetical protein
MVALEWICYGIILVCLFSFVMIAKHHKRQQVAMIAKRTKIAKKGDKS